MSVSSRDVAGGYAHASDHHAVDLDEESFRRLLTACYDRLASVAAEGETISYEELADDIGLDENRRFSSANQNASRSGDVDGREELTPLLDAIAYIEAKAGRPPLPVLVVKSRTGKPGVEFFDSVERLGLDDGYRARTDDELLAMMATNVYAAWQT